MVWLFLAAGPQYDRTRHATDLSLSASSARSSAVSPLASAAATRSHNSSSTAALWRVSLHADLTILAKLSCALTRRNPLLLWSSATRQGK